MDYDTVSGMWINVVEYAYNEWNNSGMAFEIEEDGGSSSDVYVIYDSGEPIGECDVTTSGDEIIRADINLNSYYCASSYGPYYPYPSWYDGQGVCTHEFGHFLGLCHSQYPYTTMSSHPPGTITCRSLEYDDWYAINYLY